MERISIRWERFLLINGSKADLYWLLHGATRAVMPARSCDCDGPSR
jgi:hypothetical protein